MEVGNIGLVSESGLARSILGPLSLYRALAVDTRATRPIEHIAADGVELLFILRKALGDATRVRYCAPAKPHRVGRARICVALRISDRRQRSRDCNNESNSAEFTHSVLLQISVEWTIVGIKKCSLRTRY